MNYSKDITVELKIVSSIFPDIFVGGSNRFGYSNSGSDLDFFVLMSPITEEPWASQKSFLRSFAHQAIINDAYTSSSVHYTLDILPGVDVIVMKERDEWQALKDEHDTVKLMLDKNPDLVTFIYKLKVKFPDSVKGKDIYRIILEVMNGVKDYDF